MNKLKISPNFLIGISVALLAALAFILRVCFSYSQIFKGDWIKYSSADAYYHMRLVDVMANNYPHMQGFDPYFIFPGGNPITGTSMYVRFMATVASVFGLVHPSERAIDIVGVFTPPVLATLSVVIVFFIGKALFNKWGGLLSAGMLAIIPGEFFSRTKLGFADYHCFEIFLTSLFILFIVLAMKAARKNGLSISELMHKNWQAFRKPVIYAVLAGLIYVFYALAWTGAPLFILITFAFFVLQFVIDHLKGNNTGYLGIVGGVVYLLPMLIMLPILKDGIVTFALLIAFLSCIGLMFIQRYMAGKKWNLWYFPLAILVVGGVGFALFSLIFPNMTHTVFLYFKQFRPTGTELTTIEMQPLISSTYGTGFSGAVAIVWNNYNVTFYLAFVSMLMLAYQIYKKGEYDKTLLLVWSIVMLIANLGQRRFGYYYGVNVALLMGYLAWAIIDFARARIFTEKVKQALAKAKDVKKKALKRRQDTPVAVPYVTFSLVVVIVFFTMYFWSFGPVLSAAKTVPYAPSDAWYQVLTWMRDNTPEPMGNAETYYEQYPKDGYLSYSNILSLHPDNTGNPLYYKELDSYFPYPDTAYGVLSWWDYGYWITRIAHRIPNANPGQDPRSQKDMADFFTAQDEATAINVTTRLQSKYVLIDYETAYVDPSSGSGKFWAIVTWSGGSVNDYFDIFYIQDTTDPTQYAPHILYFPEYYKSMAVRMYNFDCANVTPSFVYVIKYQEQKDKKGNTLKLVSNNGTFSFPTYDEAVAYIDSQDSGNYKIVSPDPMTTCVPLEKLDHFQVDYKSPEGLQLTSGNQTAKVKLFKYVE